MIYQHGTYIWTSPLATVVTPVKLSNLALHMQFTTTTLTDLALKTLFNLLDKYLILDRGRQQQASQFSPDTVNC